MASEWFAIGAAVGSGLAAWFRRGARWKFQFVSGFWTGWLAAHWFFDYMAWPADKIYFMFAGTLMGAISGMAFEHALSPRIWKIVITKILAWLPVPAGNK